MAVAAPSSLAVAAPSSLAVAGASLVAAFAAGAVAATGPRDAATTTARAASFGPLAPGPDAATLARNQRRFGAWYETEGALGALRRFWWTMLVQGIGTPILYVLAFGVGLAVAGVPAAQIFPPIPSIQVGGPVLEAVELRGQLDSLLLITSASVHSNCPT